MARSVAADGTSSAPTWPLVEAPATDPTPTAADAPDASGWILDPTRFTYKPALDGLRAVAVLAVVAYHFGAGWLQGGFLGVDLFFVLSGYLITSLLLIERRNTGTIRFGAFWARRFRRLLPALFVLLVAVALWGRLALPSDQWGRLRSDGVWSLFYGANWHFVLSGQSYFTTEPSMLRHMWSLAIEEQFYLLWPLVVFAALWVNRGRHVVLTVVCVLGTALSVAVMQWRFEPGRDPSRVYYGTDTRASQLLIGALLALVLVHWAPRMRVTRVGVQVAGWIGIAVVLVLFWAGRDQGTFLYRGGFVLFAVASAAVICAMVQPTGANPARAALSLRPVRWIGQISYGIYLWHWPVWVALNPARMASWGVPVTGWRLAGVQLAVTVGISALSYYLVELPIRHRRYRSKVVPTALVFGGFAVTLGVLLGATVGATTDLLAGRPGTVLGGGRNPAAGITPGGTDSPTRRTLVLGDSVAVTLTDALAQAGAEDGVTLRTIGRLGCGMTTGVSLLPDGTPVDWGTDCARATAQYQADAIAVVKPDTVLWLSTWESSDQRVDGRRLLVGTPAWEEWLLGEMERVRLLTAANGARFVLVNNPPLATNSSRIVTRDDQRRLAAVNDVMDQFATRHPDVTVVDLSSIVCPGGAPENGACAPARDGVVLRPKDGAHYEANGAAWTAPRLLDALYAALRTQAATPVPGTRADP
ncbi:MAG: acyltransferase [Actinobacteria bacterium]|nr:acyltransferase [Actinomycetota bacterium]